jgi:ketosteroid isomerase-like protein
VDESRGADDEGMPKPISTAAVVDRFNRAFLEHDPELLVDLVADECVMESVEPAPDGTRYEGRDSCLAFWQNLVTDPGSSFEPEDIVVLEDRAIIRWRYRFGDDGSIRGVNLMHVRDGQIVEALGYVKSGDTVVSEALVKATGDDA